MQIDLLNLALKNICGQVAQKNSPKSVTLHTKEILCFRTEDGWLGGCGCISHTYLIVRDYKEYNDGQQLQQDVACGVLIDARLVSNKRTPN